jgi:hypothetical protein
VNAGAASAALAAVLTLAACGSAASPGSSSPSPVPASQAAAPSSPTPATLACSTTLASGQTAQADISTLVADQKSQDSSQTQNWVLLVPDASGNALTSQGQDLQNAVTDFAPYTSGSQLASDAATFSGDATTFLTDQSSGLYPGWVSEYRPIEHDIHNLAVDCGMKYNVPPGE